MHLEPATCRRTRESQTLQPPPSCLLVRLGAVWMLLSAGCSAWRGELSPTVHSLVERGELREMQQVNLRSQARNPRTVEEDLKSLQPVKEVPASQPAARPMATSPAQDTGGGQAPELSLSVADLRRYTLQNNLDLDVIALNPEIARTLVSEERAKFDAVFSGGFGYKKQNPPRLDGSLVELDSSTKELDGKVVKLTELEQTKESLGFDFGVDVPLPTGGKVRLRNQFDESNTLEPKQFEQYVTGLKFSLSQPLLRGGGIAANVASIRLARLGGHAVSAATKLSTIRVLAMAEKVYWNVYTARRGLDIRTQQYNIARENLELVRRRVREGLSPDIEIIRAEVGVASRIEALIMAQTSYRLHQRDLKRILNTPDLDLDSPDTIAVASDPELIRLDLDRAALVRSALDNRMEMLELELNLAADAIRVDLARNEALPLFVLDFEYGILDRHGSFGTSWQGMWDFDNSGFAVAVRGEIPATNEQRKSRLRRAVLNRTQRLATRRTREMIIRQEVLDAVDVLDQNWQRILAARQNTIVSGTNYEAELKQFKAGMRTMREVLEALSQLGDAQLREVQAIQAYQVAQIDLAFATGTLLGYSGVALEPMPMPEP